jgi:transposase
MLFEIIPESRSPSPGFPTPKRTLVRQYLRMPSKALDDIRSAEARRMKGDGYEPVLTKSRWCLLKRPANLTANQKVKLKDLVRYNLQTLRAYLLKEDFQQLWNYESTG